MGTGRLNIEGQSADDQHLALAERSHVAHEPPRAIAEPDMLAR